MKTAFITLSLCWVNRLLAVCLLVVTFTTTALAQLPTAIPCPAGEKPTAVRTPNAGWTVSTNGNNAIPGFANPNQLIDGNLGSAWASNNNPALSAVNPKRITIDFGSQRTVAGLLMVPRTGAQNAGLGLIYNYQIHVSNDNVNWVQVATGTWSYLPSNGLSDVGAPRSVLFGGNYYNARYIRLSATSGSDEYISLFELSIFECGTPAAQVTIGCDNFNLLNSGTNLVGSGKRATNFWDNNWDVAYVSGGLPTAPTNPSLANVANWRPAIISGRITPAWVVSPFGNAEWISATLTSLDVDQRGVGTPGDISDNGLNDYFFRYRFNLNDPYQLAAFRIQMDFMSDNTVYNVYVNGVSQTGKVPGLPQNTVNAYQGGGFLDGNQAQMVLPYDWQLGTNELIIHVKSQPGFVGFLAQNVTFCAGLDFGDAPASYGITKAQMGAGHIIKSDINGNVLLRMGNLLDAESDGTASADASNDDATGSDDEDGVTFSTVCEGSTTVTATVNVYNTNTPDAKLYGWIDFNQNGIFEATEAAPVIPAGVSGNYLLTWTGVSGLTAGTNLIARIRLTSDPNISANTPNNPAYDGEVEDYQVTVTTPPTITASITSQTVCSGDVVTIDYTTSPASSVQWSRMPGNVTGFGNVINVPTTITATAPTTYTYTARATGGACPSNIATTVVTVNPRPVVTPSVCSQTICSGQTGNITFVSSVPGSTIHWERTPTTPTPSSGTGDISQSFINTGPSSLTYTYKIWATSPAPASCPSSTTITCEIVVTSGLEVAALASSATVCVGSPLSLSTSVVPTGNYTYAWTGPGGYVSSGATPTVSASADLTNSGSYTVVVTDAAGCSGTAVVPVMVQDCCDLEASVATAPSTSCITPNGSLTLTYEGSSSYQYSLNGGANTPLTASPLVLSNLAPGSYTLVVTDVASTTCMVTREVTIQDPSVTVYANSNSPVCATNLLELYATTGQTSGLQYAWVGPNNFVSTAQNPTLPNASTLASGVYTVTVTDAGGCSSSASTTVDIVDQPVLSIAASGSQTVCSGESTTLTVSGADGATVVWSNNLGQSGTGTSIDTGVLMNQGTEPGIIVYTVSASAGGTCVDTESFTVVVNPVPVVVVAPSSAVYCDIEQVNLKATASPNTATINWSRTPNLPNPPVDTGSGTTPLVIQQQLPAGSYTYQFTATGANGCTSQPINIPVTVQQ